VYYHSNKIEGQTAPVLESLAYDDDNGLIDELNEIKRLKKKKPSEHSTIAKS